MNTLELLEKGREIVQGHWTKGEFRYYDEASDMLLFCAVGALDAASGVEWDPEEGYGDRPAIVYDAVELLGACVPEGYDGATGTPMEVVTGFNDDDMTTEPDILQMYDCAIKKAGSIQ